MSFQTFKSSAKTSRVQVKRNSAVLLDLAFEQLATERHCTDSANEEKRENEVLSEKTANVQNEQKW